MWRKEKRRNEDSGYKKRNDDRWIAGGTKGKDIILWYQRTWLDIGAGDGEFDHERDG